MEKLNRFHVPFSNLSYLRITSAILISLCCAQGLIGQGRVVGSQQTQTETRSSTRPRTQSETQSQDNTDAGRSPKKKGYADETSPIDDQYRIGPGDVLDIRVFQYQQLSRDGARVDGRGMIRMPLIDGEIQAACRTESDLAQEIATRYLKYQRNPHVDVFVKEYNSQPVAVIGSVEKPGRIQLQRRARLADLISFAGGPTERAGTRIQIAHTGGVVTCRGSEMITSAAASTEEFETYELADTLAGNTKSNPYLQPGDIVNIPEAKQAFVVGNVFKPVVIPLKESVTVSQAIAMAGGILPDSNSKGVRLIRRLSGAKEKRETVLNLNDIARRQADDVELQPGDIIDVPTLSGRKLLRNIFTAIVPSIVNLPLLVLR